MAIQGQVEFISFNNSNNNEYTYKINRWDTIFYTEKFYPRVFKFYWLNQFTNNVSS